MKLSVTKSGNACGADIKFDLSLELDDRTFAEIEQTFHDNIVVYFRGQQLSNERHIEFSRRFGELEIHVLKKYLLPNYPEILLISNIKDENGGSQHARSGGHDARNPTSAGYRGGLQGAQELGGRPLCLYRRRTDPHQPDSNQYLSAGRTTADDARGSNLHRRRRSDVVRTKLSGYVP